MSTQTATARPAPAAAPSQSRSEVAIIRPPRLPYPQGADERFGIDRAAWKALVEAVFPAAKSPDSVILALSYCKARRLDPFKRVIHIVPVWDNEQRKLVETVWPGIAELRTTAFRTGDYAGREPSEFGETLSRKVGSLQIDFPEWAQVTVYRMVKGQRCPFPGPRVYWLETYAQQKRDDPTPNSMWAKRTRAQLDKCAEAAALRAAFPEEIGGDMIDDEIRERVEIVDPAPSRPTRREFAQSPRPAQGALVHPGITPEPDEYAAEDGGDGDATDMDDGTADAESIPAVGADAPAADAPPAQTGPDRSAYAIPINKGRDGKPNFLEWTNTALSLLNAARSDAEIEETIAANLDVLDDMQERDAPRRKLFSEKVVAIRQRLAADAAG